jgi:glutamate dehydrogenase (NAD(P)+)
LAYCIEEWAKDRDEELKGKTFITQGFGAMGSNAVELLAQLGCRPLAIADIEGAIYNAHGIDVDALMRYVFENPSNLKRTVVGFPEATPISTKDFWQLKADIVVAAAHENEITPDIAVKLKVKLVAEVANTPTTPPADEILKARKIDLIPDVIGNAGAVTVSYYEWLQNERMEHWSEQEVLARLERAIKSNYRIIRDIARNTPSRTDFHDSRRFCIGKEIDMRLSAMVLALKRIEAHYMLEGFSQ